MKGNISMFMGGLLIAFISLILFFNQIYISEYLGKEQTEILFENTAYNNFNFNFDNRDITQCYKDNFNYCFINLYIDEFKNNETVEKIENFQINKCYYAVDELSYQMSFYFDKNCLEDLNQEIKINKTSSLTINKIEIEYIGFDRKTFNIGDILGWILLVLCFTGTLIMIYSSEV